MHIRQSYTLQNVVACSHLEMRVIYFPFCVPIVDGFSQVPGVRFVDKFLKWSVDMAACSQTLVVGGYGGLFPNFSGRWIWRLVPKL